MSSCSEIIDVVLVVNGGRVRSTVSHKRLLLRSVGLLISCELDFKFMKFKHQCVDCVACVAFSAFSVGSTKV